ncbi:hypothetical protein VTO42DRAFT_6964 [Malbranchea cinnamomea]
MCGRYALGVRASFIRYQLQQLGQRVDDAPDDDEVRETYNFAPGNYGAVYRADTPEWNYDTRQEEETAPEVLQQDSTATDETEEKHGTSTSTDTQPSPDQTRYILQAMKWGLIPFWTKRNPDYGSLMRTINCRDDSLVENRGMWTSMKKRKRCVVVCQGFYEWLKKGPGGKEKVPHFVKRKDGNLMCFAGLWDCVQYEGSDEKLYTYTIITTSSNTQLKFLHDRMPVILDPNSPAMDAWLDPKRTTWTKELQSILKPYEGELECYPVSKEVGKVGNNSPDFIIPINSKENKKNIANFFAAKGSKDSTKPQISPGSAVKAEQRADDNKADTKADKTTHAKRALSPEEQDGEDLKPHKVPKTEPLSSPPSKVAGRRRMHSATSNNTVPAKAGEKKKTAAHGTPRITNFFKK